MDNKRPINLNLLTIRFPIPAIVSILHRISGVVLFLFIPVALWGLGFSLTEQGFNILQGWLGSFYIKLMLWLLLIPFCYHFVAGIRHLLMDIHIGEQLQSGRRTAQLTFIIFLLLILLAGVWLW